MIEQGPVSQGYMDNVWNSAMVALLIEKKVRHYTRDQVYPTVAQVHGPKLSEGQIRGHTKVRKGQKSLVDCDLAKDYQESQAGQG